MRRVLAVTTLLTSAGTLVCCALPALFVVLGSGAAFASLVTAFPQLVWLSEHKALTFGSAGTLLGASALLRMGALSASCPTDPKLSEACRSTRSWTRYAFWIAIAFFVLGCVFAFAPSLLGWA